MKLVLINIKNSIKEYKGVYVLLIVSQLLAVIMLFMAYGIFCSYNASKQEYDESCYELSAFFSENVMMGEFKECYTEILEQVEPRLNYFFLFAKSEDYEIVTYNEYHNGRFTNSDKIYKYKRLKEGRLVTDQEINDRKNYVHGMNVGSVGDIIEIEEKMFQVVGVEEDEWLGTTIHMAITCYPDGVVLKNFVLEFEKLPTLKDYEVFKRVLENEFGEKVTIQEYKVKNEEQLIAINSIIVLSVAVGVIAALDTALLYGYIMKKRKRQMAIFAICGAKRLYRIIINEIEIFIVSLVTATIGFVIFRLLVEKIMNYVYNNTVSIYSMTAYGLMLVMYLLSIVILTTIATIIVNRKRILDMRRECSV